MIDTPSRGDLGRVRGSQCLGSAARHNCPHQVVSPSKERWPQKSYESAALSLEKVMTHAKLNLRVFCILLSRPKFSIVCMIVT